MWHWRGAPTETAQQFPRSCAARGKSHPQLAPWDQESFLTASVSSVKKMVGCSAREDGLVWFRKSTVSPLWVSSSDHNQISFLNCWTVCQNFFGANWKSFSTDPRNSLHKPADKPRHRWHPAYGAQVATMASTSEPPSNVFQSCLERTPLCLHALAKRKRQAFKTQMDRPPPLDVPCSSTATLIGSTKRVVI